MHTVAWMLLATGSFTLMAYIIKIQSGNFGILDILFYRSIASVAWVLVLYSLLRFPLRTRVFPVHVRRSLCGMVAMGTWYYTLGVLPMGVSVTLNYMSPLFLALILFFAGAKEERPGGRDLTYILLGFLGVACILDPLGADLSRRDALAVLCGVAAAFVAALAFKDVKILKRAGENEWQMVFYFSLTSAGMAYPLTSVARLDFSGPPSGYMALLLAGVLGALGQFAVSKAFGAGNQMVAASMQYLSVIFSLLLSWYALGETVSGSQLLGIAIIVASALLTVLSRK